MKQVESRRKMQKVQDRHDDITGSLVLVGLMILAMGIVFIARRDTILGGCAITVGALMFEGGFMLNKIFRLKDGRDK